MILLSVKQLSPEQITVFHVEFTVITRWRASVAQMKRTFISQIPGANQLIGRQEVAIPKQQHMATGM